MTDFFFAPRTCPAALSHLDVVENVWASTVEVWLPHDNSNSATPQDDSQRHLWTLAQAKHRVSILNPHTALARSSAQGAWESGSIFSHRTDWSDSLEISHG